MSQQYFYYICKFETNYFFINVTLQLHLCHYYVIAHRCAMFNPEQYLFLLCSEKEYRHQIPLEGSGFFSVIFIHASPRSPNRRLRGPGHPIVQ